MTSDVGLVAVDPAAEALLGSRAVRELLAAFSEATELPITLRDLRGRFIGPASGTPRWCQLLRRSSFGFEGCRREAVANAPSAPDEVVEFVCHEVARHLTTGVFSGGRLIAQIIVGPFAELPIPEEAASREAGATGAPSDDLTISRREVKWLPRRRAQAARRVLLAVAQAVSQMVSQAAEASRLHAELSALRHPSPAGSEARDEVPILQTDGSVVGQVERRAISVDGRVVKLTPKEARILASLARRPNRPVPVEVLLDEAWPDGDGDPTQLWVHIRGLRRKIEHDPSVPTRITTSRGAGYTLVSETPAAG